MKYLVVGVVVFVVVLALMLRLRGDRRRKPDSVQGFRRHMDALSKESRRDVIDRVRDADGRDGNDGREGRRGVNGPGS
jgi:hypothetical protein